MATTAPPARPGRATPPARRSTSSTASSSPPGSIAKGATARSAVSAPRVSSSLNSSATRRPSIKSPTRNSTSPPPVVNSETRESLTASLKEETDQKEHLLVQLQTKDQTISTLTGENDNIQSALHAAETRLNEFYADQGRMEEEMAARIEVAEKLRSQVRELEKEKRDTQRLYNEQTTTFEAERQASYDNEQHLKSRIQSLTQARVAQSRKQVEQSSGNDLEPEQDNSEDTQEAPQSAPDSSPAKQDVADPEQEPAEMTSLKLELSTLSTSYSSLQNTLVLLQTQLVDLKRVNHELQEENESYMILLREKTLSGRFDVGKQVGAGSSTDDEDDDDLDVDAGGDVRSMSSTARSTLDPVEEEVMSGSLGDELSRSELDSHDADSQSISSSNARHASRHGRKRGSSTSESGSAPRGESLAGLPLTGPGLDLAAELGRAENKDILDGVSVEEQDRSILTGKGKKGKKGARDVSGGLELIGSHSDLDALKTEVKSLKDANKALSLYASKIIDRIISQEGFEHVLAVDFDPATPTTPGGKGPTPMTNLPSPAKVSKPRPQSAIFGGRSTSGPIPAPLKIAEKLTTFASPPTSPNPDVSAIKATAKASRRSLSLDWKSFSIFSNSKPENPSLRPLTLKPGAASVTGTTNARKLDTQEDEDDRRERERLQATMKLMGIEQPSVTAPTPTTAIPHAAPSLERSNSTSSASPAPARSRWSFFGGSAPATNTETSSVHSASSIQNSPRPSMGGEDRPSGLTQEALEHVEAENSLAALDAHEKVLSAEIARGASSGFTEIARRSSEGRRSRRSRMSGGGSASGGSTVWSAGIDEVSD